MVVEGAWNRTRVPREGLMLSRHPALASRPTFRDPGAEERTRTFHTLIFNQLLYQMSYLGEEVAPRRGIEPLFAHRQ